MVSNEFKLSSEERHSSLWLKLERLTAERLASARRENDGALDQDKTARVRGRISELKSLRLLLAMDESLSPAKVADGLGPLPGETG